MAESTPHACTGICIWWARSRPEAARRTAKRETRARRAIRTRTHASSSSAPRRELLEDMRLSPRGPYAPENEQQHQEADGAECASRCNAPTYLVVLPRTTGGRALRNALHRRVNFVSPLALRFREHRQRRKLAAHLEITQRQAAQPYCCCSSAPRRKAPSSQTVGVGLATAVRRATVWAWSPTCAGEVGQHEIGRSHADDASRACSGKSV